MIPKSPVEEAFYNVVNPFWANLSQIVNMYYLFLREDWFINGLKDQQLVEFLDYVVVGKETQSLFDLVQAFRLQGTCSSLSYFSRAVFGDTSTSIIDDSEAGVISVAVQNANTLFNIAQLTSDGAYVQLDSTSDFIQLATDVQDVTGYDVFNLFRQMVYNGRTLKSVTINS